MGAATGNKHVLVTCATCNGSGEVKGLNRRREFVKDVCPICFGKGKISVSRKSA